jgi:hypothetical protein
MGYTHYWNYKNPVIEMGQIMNKKLQIHRMSRDWVDRESKYQELPTHESNLKRIKKHIDGFKKIAVDLNKILPEIQKDKDFKIKGGLGKGEPRISENEVWFNGDSDFELDQETFGIDLFETGNYRGVDDIGKDGVFGFCKTAHKPYDFAVMIALMVIKHHLGSDFSISSDGGLEDGWDEAIQYYESFFKRKAPKQLKNYFEKENV